MQQRQEWITKTLRVFGLINREHLERKFNISTPQASSDVLVSAAAFGRDILQRLCLALPAGH
ncbi:hypothetical protein ABIE89_000386 [Bradyrhizobium niftali]|uniref:hypothetical protein n=1 Tax=Bradyrhizobium niftali TaxID=2560055 RepID=UPI0038323F03